MNCKAINREYINSFVNGTTYYVGRTFDVVTDPYKLTNKTVTFIKATKTVVEVFTILSEGISRVFVYAEPIKAIAIPLYTRKAFRAAINFVKAENFETRIKSSFKFYRSLKKCTSGVSSIFKFSVTLGLLASSTLRWTDITGWIFLPVTFISAALNFEDTLARTRLLVDFWKSERKGMESAAKFVVENKERLRKFKIVSKDFYKRFEPIAKSIGQTKETGEAEMIFRRMKIRMGEFIFLKASKTALKITSCVVTILGLVSVIGILPAAIIDLALAVGSLGFFGYAKYLSRTPTLLS